MVDRVGEGLNRPSFQSPLVGWLHGWLAAWLAGCMAGCMAGWLHGCTAHHSRVEL